MKNMENTKSMENIENIETADILKKSKKELRQEKKKAKKEQKKKNRKESYFKSLFSELKQVEWCGFKNLIKYTAIAVVIGTVMALILWGLNSLSAEIVSIVKGAF